MINELIAFLNFDFEIKMVNIQTLVGEQITKQKRWVINWRNYIETLEKLTGKSELDQYTFFNRYLVSSESPSAFEEIINFQTEIKNFFQRSLKNQRLDFSEAKKIFKEASELKTTIEFDEKYINHISPETLPKLKFKYNYYSDTYRTFVMAVIRSLILNHCFFQLRIDQNNKFFINGEIQSETKDLSPFSSNEEIKNTLKEVAYTDKITKAFTNLPEIYKQHDDCLEKNTNSENISENHLENKNETISALETQDEIQIEKTFAFNEEIFENESEIISTSETQNEIQIEKTFAFNEEILENESKTISALETQDEIQIEKTFAFNEEILENESETISASETQDEIQIEKTFAFNEEIFENESEIISTSETQDEIQIEKTFAFNEEILENESETISASETQDEIQIEKTFAFNEEIFENESEIISATEAQDEKINHSADKNYHLTQSPKLNKLENWRQLLIKKNSQEEEKLVQKNGFMFNQDKKDEDFIDINIANDDENNEKTISSKTELINNVLERNKVIKKKKQAGSQPENLIAAFEYYKLQESQKNASQAPYQQQLNFD